ncbi:TetR/AcrR family transcriptional regulator [Streptomyces liangshanensis]|uniref:TetR/AcrR family transcriptional regulator n=1 Tax=Streptomyces liangshanensis TaxID=2717324 RepID=UPI0036D78AC6
MNARLPDASVTTGNPNVRPTASGRKRRSDGERSFRVIMEAAVRLAVDRGLDGLSINDLAVETGMSKGGLYAHFGSKQALQLATIVEAARVQADLVVDPALRLADPLARLHALCENFLRCVQEGPTGGCFLASVSAEFDTRPGVVRDSILEQHQLWGGMLVQLVEGARDAGQLELRGKDAAQLAFEVNALLHLGNDAYVLYRDTEVLQRARQGLAWLLDQHGTGI